MCAHNNFFAHDCFDIMLQGPFTQAIFGAFLRSDSNNWGDLNAILMTTLNTRLACALIPATTQHFEGEITLL